MNSLSVIVSVYNKAKHLPQCLASLTAQTYKNIEIICVNDGSADESLQILQACAAQDKRIKIISQANQGPSAARNAGLKAASGEYIGFMDADDRLDVNAYTYLLPLFMLYPDSDFIAFGAQVLVGEQGAIKQKGDDDYYTVHHNGLLSINPDILLTENLSACTKIFRRSIIEAHNICFKNGYYYEDFHFCWNYMLHCRAGFFIDYKPYKYIRYKQSIMASTFKGDDKAIDHLALLDDLFSRFLTPAQPNIFTAAAEQAFKSYFWLAYQHSSTDSGRKKVLRLAEAMVKKYDLARLYPGSILIRNISAGKMWRYPNIDEYRFCQKIFCVKKFSYDKYIRLCGLKLKFKRRRYKRMKNFLES